MIQFIFSTAPASTMLRSRGACGGLASVPEPLFRWGVRSALPANRPQRFRCSLAESCEPSRLSPPQRGSPAAQTWSSYANRNSLVPASLHMLDFARSTAPLKSPRGVAGSCTPKFCSPCPLVFATSSHTFRVTMFVWYLFFNLLRLKPPISPLQSLSLKPPRYPAAALSPCVV